MALETAVNRAVKRVVQVFRDYARAQGWGPGDYELYLRLNEDWGRIHVLLVARDYPGRYIEERWLSVVDFVDQALHDDPGLANAITLTLRTYDEVAKGGI